MQPYVKGYVANVNSVYNGFRFEDVWLDKPQGSLATLSIPH
jgi:peptide/nickel transport system substrate-binding protein